MADEDEDIEDGAENDNADDAERGDGEEGEEGEGGEGAKAGGDKKKLIMIAGAALVLLIGGGAGAYFTGLLDGLLGIEKAEVMLDEHGNPVLDEHGEPVMVEKSEEHADSGHGKDKKKGGGHGEEGGADGNFVVIPTMMVNLNSEDGTPRYLRLSVQLEMENSDDVHAVEAVMPRVVDQFQTYLRELRVRDLRGSAGIYRLQTELLWRVNQAAAPVEVKDVLFQEILIQ